MPPYPRRLAVSAPPFEPLGSQDEPDQPAALFLSLFLNACQHYNRFIFKHQPDGDSQRLSMAVHSPPIVRSNGSLFAGLLLMPDKSSYNVNHVGISFHFRQTRVP